MPGDQMLLALRKRPFEPFIIHVDDGTRYEIRHPETVLPGVGYAHIGVPGNPGQLFDRIDVVSMDHISRLEPLPKPISN